MKITINGELREIPDGFSVAALLQHLEMTAERVAIERNLDILPQPDDRFEIVHLVGGG
jgi:thiamine biosynthesis protein ThiS